MREKHTWRGQNTSMTFFKKITKCSLKVLIWNTNIISKIKKDYIRFFVRCQLANECIYWFCGL